MVVCYYDMKKLLGTIAALSLFASPVIADPEIKQWKTYNSLGCMLLRECKEDVTEIKSVDDIRKINPSINYSGIEDEMNQLLTEFNRIGVGVYVADGKYFPRLHRGVYQTVKNNFYLNKDYVWDTKQLLTVTRHEGWHAAQDCMAGTIDNNNIAIIHQDGYIPNQYSIRANVIYAMQRKAIPWETEALWAGDTEGVTVGVLKACKSDRPMWEIYPPTPMTTEWLVEKGFWDGK